MVKHTQTICRLLPMNCVSVFEHFVGLAVKGLSTFHLKKWVHCAEMSGALRDLVPFVQFKKRENTHGGVILLL